MDKTSANQGTEEQIRMKERRTLFQNEPIAAFFPINILEISPGFARVSLKMKPEYCNFHGVVQGGVTMTLADFAFGFAVNTVAMPSVASQLNFHFIARVEPGDEITAECRMLKNGRRVGISEVTLTNQKGELVMKATGTTIPVAK